MKVIFTGKVLYHHLPAKAITPVGFSTETGESAHRKWGCTVYKALLGQSEGERPERAEFLPMGRAISTNTHYGVAGRHLHPHPS